MAKKLPVINQLRPRLVSQAVVELETLAERVSKNTTYNIEEIYSILRLNTKEIIAALEAGETVKIDGLFSFSPNMKVGGEVDLSIRLDRGLISRLNNPLLWTADKVVNHANLRKTVDELIEQWDAAHPTDPVTE